MGLGWRRSETAMGSHPTEQEATIHLVPASSGEPLGDILALHEGRCLSSQEGESRDLRVLILMAGTVL